jgi:hypothetical protein
MKSPKPATDTIYPHIKFWWYRTMLNFYPPFLCRVLAALLKISIICFAIALSVRPLLFVLPLYCLSLLYYLFGHCIVCPFSIICLAIVLPVPPLLFVWPLYCLFLLYYLFGHCIVCPSSIICLAIVLSVPPLLFVLPLYCLFLLYYFFYHCIVCPSSIICLAIVLSVSYGQTNNRGGKDNTMAKQIIEEGQTIQWPNK